MRQQLIMAVVSLKRELMALNDLVGIPANCCQKRKQTSLVACVNELPYYMRYDTGDHI